MDIGAPRARPCSALDSANQSPATPSFPAVAGQGGWKARHRGTFDATDLQQSLSQEGNRIQGSARPARLILVAGIIIVCFGLQITVITSGAGVWEWPTWIVDDPDWQPATIVVTGALVVAGTTALWWRWFRSRRTLLWITLALIVVTTATTAALSRSAARRPDAYVTVGIGFFDGDAGDRFQLSRAVYDEVVKGLKTYPGIRVIKVVAQSRQSETPEDALRRIARRRRVNVLVWGWYTVPGDTGSLTTNFETRMKGFGFRYTHQRELVAASDFTRFTVHGALAGQTKYVALVTLGLTSFAAGKPKQAIQHIDEALALRTSPDSVLPPAVVYAMRGWMNGRISNRSAAIQDYRTAIQLGLRNPEVYLELAYELWTGAPIAALAALDTAAQLDTTLYSYPEYLVNRAGFYLAAGLPDSAVALCRHRSRYLNGASHSLLFNRNINCGLAHERTGDADSAFYFYRSAQRLNPNHSISYQRLGELEAVLGDSARHRGDRTDAIRRYRQSVGYLSRGIKIDPERPDFYTIRGPVLRNLAILRGASVDTVLLRRALDDFERANRLVRTSPPGHPFIGPGPFAYDVSIGDHLHLGDPEGAQSMLWERAQLWGVSDTAAIVNMYAHIMELALEDSKHAETALDAANRLILLYPKLSNGYFARALINAHAGNLDGAVRDAETAVRLDCGYGATQFFLFSDLAPPTLLSLTRDVHALTGNVRGLQQWEGLAGNYIAIRRGLLRCDSERPSLRSGTE